VIGGRRHVGDECRRLNQPGSTMPRAKTARSEVKTSLNSVYDEIDRGFNDDANRLLQIRDSDGQGNQLGVIN